MNKEKIAILVDSGSDVPPELLERHHIFMIPLKILFNEGEYLDGLTIDASEVYRRLPFEIPKTSLPDGEQIISILDRIYEEGYRKVLAICISSSLSGTCNMLRLICEEYENLECHVVDSKNISIGSGIIAVRAAQLLEEGMGFEELCRKTEEMIPNSKVFFCLKTLEYLQKGGRIGKVAAFLGSAISLKPVISCNEEGAYYAVVKSIGRNPSIKKVLELAQKFAEGCPKAMLAVMHGDAAEEAEALISEVKKKIPQGITAVRGQISPALGVHTGPGLVGICVLKEC